MKEQKLNILDDELLFIADAVCFTSNGVLNNKGELVMGAGVAKAFKQKWPDISMLAGNVVKTNGNICQIITTMSYNMMFSKTVKLVGFHKVDVIAFPTKEHWRDQSDIDLIIKSSIELMKLCNAHSYKSVYLPRPGCACGGLDWEKEVKPAIKDILDERIIICHL